jgi:hypothetical protein
MPVGGITSRMSRRLISSIVLVVAIATLAFRVHEINRVPELVGPAPRTVHLLYLDSLRAELLTFAEQYGRPVFEHDTTSPVTGHGRIQLARLREALFDSRVAYSFGDEGFSLDWRSDPRPRPRSKGFSAFGTRGAVTFAHSWPPTAAEYARLRRLFVTPQWPDPPQRRVNRPRRSPVPPQGDGTLHATLHSPLSTLH